MMRPPFHTICVNVSRCRRPTTSRVPQPANRRPSPGLHQVGSRRRRLRWPPPARRNCWRRSTLTARPRTRRRRGGGLASRPGRAEVGHYQDWRRKRRNDDGLARDLLTLQSGWCNERQIRGSNLECGYHSGSEFCERHGAGRRTTDRPVALARISTETGLAASGVRRNWT